MELFKRKILIESLISRDSEYRYGEITADTINVNVFLTQNIEDLGIFTDEEYSDEPWDPSQHIAWMTLSGLTAEDFPMMTGGTITGALDPNEYTPDLRPPGRTVDYYYTSGTPFTVTAFTSSHINEYWSVQRSMRYKFNIAVEKAAYIDFNGQSVIGERMITYPPNPDPDTMVITAVNEYGTTYTMYPVSSITENIGNYYPNIGSLATTVNPEYPEELNTVVTYQSMGWYSGNTSLSAITKEELYLGIVEPPEIQTDVFIDRGAISAIEQHLRLSEVESLEHLMKYGGGNPNKPGSGFYYVKTNDL